MEAETPRRHEEARRQRFDKLTSQHRHVLHAVAMRCCSRDRAVADDLVQDALERAWRSFESLQDDNKVLPWMITILRRCWIDICRKRVPDLPVAEVPDQPQPIEEPPPWLQITIEHFHRAIDQLDEPFRSVAVLHDVDQLSNADIARRLGIPYNTVATRLHRAHKQLLQLLRRELDGAKEG